MSRPAGSVSDAASITHPSNYDYAAIIAHEVIENHIEFIDDELGNETPTPETINRLLNHDEIHQANDKDFDTVHEKMTSEINAVASSILMQASGEQWKETLRWKKNQLSVFLRGQIDSVKNGTAKWANLASSLTKEVGSSDAAFIAGAICLIENVFGECVKEQIADDQLESGKVADKFMEAMF